MFFFIIIISVSLFHRAPFRLVLKQQLTIVRFIIIIIIIIIVIIIYYYY